MAARGRRSLLACRRVERMGPDSGGVMCEAKKNREPSRARKKTKERQRRARQRGNDRPGALGANIDECASSLLSPPRPPDSFPRRSSDAPQRERDKKRGTTYCRFACEHGKGPADRGEGGWGGRSSTPSLVGGCVYLSAPGRRGAVRMRPAALSLTRRLRVVYNA